jgi:DNA-binding transcriptional regulator YiaG
MKKTLVLGRTTRKQALQALYDVDKALAGLPSSYSRVELPIPASKAEVRKVRRALNVTQRDFAKVIGASVQTIKSWESGERKPEGPATKLIRWLAKHPSAAGQFAKI